MSEALPIEVLVLLEEPARPSATLQGLAAPQFHARSAALAELDVVAPVVGEARAAAPLDVVLIEVARLDSSTIASAVATAQRIAGERPDLVLIAHAADDDAVAAAYDAGVDEVVLGAIGGGSLRARVQSAGRRALARRSARSLHLALGRVREELSRARRRAAIGAIAAGLAHEINNPAAFVVADLHELRDLADEVEDPGQAASLRTLADEALAGMDRIRDAIRDLSVFAAAAHRRSLGPPQPLDLATLLRQRCARLGLGERIELAIAGDARVLLPPGAEDELEALLGLLLREATAPSDGPSVQGRVRVGLRASGAEVALSLRPPADAATPTDDPSLALPLAIAAELAERLSGQIEARDGGFGLRLPAAPVVEPTSELADRAPVVGAPGARVERPGGV